MPVIRSFNSNSVVIQTIYSKFVPIRTLYSKFYVIRILCIRIYIVIRTHLYASSTSSTYIALQPLGAFDLSSTSSTLLWSFVQYSMHSMLCIFDIFCIMLEIILQFFTLYYEYKRYLQYKFMLHCYRVSARSVSTNTNRLGTTKEPRYMDVTGQIRLNRIIWSMDF